MQMLHPRRPANSDILFNKVKSPCHFRDVTGINLGKGTKTGLEGSLCGLLFNRSSLAFTCQT